MYGLSIVICTYNPEQAIFQRVLNAIGGAILPSQWTVECIIIDNNSTKPLSTELYIRQILPSLPQARVIVEARQGLTWSRIRGIKESAHEYLLFVDDDNEIDHDFLIQLAEAVTQHPHLGAFNPGVIRVQYVGTVSEWFHTKGKVHFQESDIPNTIWSKDNTTFRHWPFGTGLTIKKEVAMYYISLVENGQFTLSDRKGSILTSGGDGQLVASALKLDFAVGRIRGMKLNHLIAARKATLAYLTRQDYGIYFANEIFLRECYPESFRSLTVLQEAGLLLKLFTRDLLWYLLRSDLKKYRIAVAIRVGGINGKRNAAGKKLPFILKELEKMLIR